MLINEIPDDCLLAIFDHLNSLEDLVNCYKVCVKWSYLIAVRTKKVKYSNLYFQMSVFIPLMLFIIENCIRLIQPIVELSINLKPTYEDAIEFVKKLEFLKGLINQIDLPIEKYCDQLEMLSVEYFNPNNLRNGSSIKQLDIWNYSLDFLKKDAHYLPNLERLKIQIYSPDYFYDGPVLEKLKILELSFHAPWDSIIFYGFKLMDLCPNLQSAHICMAANTYFFDGTLKHKCFTRVGNENDLKRLLMKYPNLKHLALRDAWRITEEHIEQLFHILPNLVVLDVRKCYEVTQEAADYVKYYCKRYGRSIKFYFDGNEHEIESDWPQSSIKHETISLGFDFMKNCFFRQHDFLPNFLIPIDY
uniref:F-box domain-containing protein n=1 Tax=Tetranychus urticae TaxID=32264 RepID=T1L2R0_TETUR